MGTGESGTFVISWSQTEADGMRAPDLGVLRVGAGWRWTGQAVRMDVPGPALLLDGAEGSEELRRRAARMVRRLIGAALEPRGPGLPPDMGPDMGQGGPDEAPEQGFVLTDGRRSHVATLIAVPGTGARLLMFTGRMPPAATDLWVVRSTVEPGPERPAGPERGGVICFTPGTRIATPGGPRPIEALRPGDFIDTRDNGPQEILWTGHRRMSGARLYAMPHLRPVRFRAEALGSGRPDRELLVSPHHRMLVRGAAAQALFGIPEVLVRAADLVNDHSVTVDTALREVGYIHILLENHQIVLANGMETESFHPADADLDTIEATQREALLAVLPTAGRDPQLYGAPVRRALTMAEAAILRHEAA